MRRSQRLIATAVLLSLTGALAGCTGGMNSFDPNNHIKTVTVVGVGGTVPRSPAFWGASYTTCNAIAVIRRRLC